MKITRQPYRTGSVRKVSRSQEFAWEFRFYITAPDAKRKLKVQTFESIKYPTERDVCLAIQGQLAALNPDTLGGKVNITFGMVIDRYLKEELPSLRHSTQTTTRACWNCTFVPIGVSIGFQIPVLLRSRNGWTPFPLVRPPRSEREAPFPGSWTWPCSGNTYRCSGIRWNWLGNYIFNFPDHKGLWPFLSGNRYRLRLGS